MQPKVKIALAGGVAVALVGVAGVIGARSLGVGRQVRSAQEASEPPRGEGPGPMRVPGPPGGSWEQKEGGPETVEFSGPPPKWMEQDQALDRAAAEVVGFPTDRDAATSFTAGAEDLALRAESDEALGTLGIASRRGLIESWRAFLQPLIEADQPAFERAVAELGGEATPGESGQTPAAALFGRLSDYLAGARINLAAARLVDRDATEPGAVPLAPPSFDLGSRTAVAIPMMVDVRHTADGEGNTSTVRTLNVPLGPLFPGAAELAGGGAKTVQVWAPAKLKSGKGDRADIGPSAYFVLNQQTGQWQPVAIRITLASEQAIQTLDEAMRSRRRAVQD